MGGGINTHLCWLSHTFGPPPSKSNINYHRRWAEGPAITAQPADSCLALLAGSSSYSSSSRRAVYFALLFVAPKETVKLSNSPRPASVKSAIICRLMNDKRCQLLQPKKKGESTSLLLFFYWLIVNLNRPLRGAGQRPIIIIIKYIKCGVVS